VARVETPRRNWGRRRGKRSLSAIGYAFSARRNPLHRATVEISPMRASAPWMRITPQDEPPSSVRAFSAIVSRPAHGAVVELAGLPENFASRGLLLERSPWLSFDSSRSRIAITAWSAKVFSDQSGSR